MELVRLEKFPAITLFVRHPPGQSRNMDPTHLPAATMHRYDCKGRGEKDWGTSSMVVSPVGS